MDFWKQVATRFKNNYRVVFDVFNEPYPDGNRDTNEAWRCWRDGGTCTGIAYPVAGMQELVTAIRVSGLAPLARPITVHHLWGGRGRGCREEICLKPRWLDVH